jgi:serine/threonine protein kinase/formylglycine-generating enzyme required for sulfatase activity
MGDVYLALDLLLGRQVALKLLPCELAQDPSRRQRFLAEAKTAAALNHPNICTIHDVGESEDHRPFIAMEFLEGETLNIRLRRVSVPISEVIDVSIQLASALEAAHAKGIVHRDIKPSNILWDWRGCVKVLDFGLSKRLSGTEVTRPQRPEFKTRAGEFIGTPRYSSPEQASGVEVDHRTDLFSLGVVLYEMVTGRVPLTGSCEGGTARQMADGDAESITLLSPEAPKELERTILKCLQKDREQRYQSAQELLSDLRALRELMDDSQPTGSTLSGRTLRSNRLTAVKSELRIMPRGLRSFEPEDHAWFLRLLPGPCDEHGLPLCIRFWKERIEQVEPGRTFQVGLIYGPSGCGKTSLVKAGLIPVLAKSVIPIYVEATAGGTEATLLAELRRAISGLPMQASLRQTVESLWRHPDVLRGRKVVLLLDQFEQWLHAQSDIDKWELPRALRCCDGTLFQALIMIRDGFLLGIHRLFRTLDVRIQEGVNMAVVDLFDPDHARKVLIEYGRAYGRLGESEETFSAAQRVFLDRVVRDLENPEEKVVSAHIALLAQMLKGRQWTPDTLTQVGGPTGVGVAFLEDSFDRSTANPTHFAYRSEAMAVLKALLPEAGRQIRGYSRSKRELQTVAGLDLRPADYDQLLQVLDEDLRIITPIEPAPTEGESPSSTAGHRAARYQLTHDYLIAPLRTWLTRTQRETSRGRAVLCLEQRTDEWNATRQHRFLPSLSEYIRILCLAPRTGLKLNQRAMLRAAHRFYCRWAALVGVLALIAAITTLSLWSRARKQNAKTLVQALLSANPSEVSYAIRDLRPHRRQAREWLHQIADAGHLDGVNATPHQQLKASFSLADLGEVRESVLLEAIAAGSPGQCPNIVSALRNAQPSALPLVRARFKESLVPELRVRFATVMLHLGDSHPAQQLLSLQKDPTLRTAFIHGYSHWAGDLIEVADLLRQANAHASDPNLLSGLCAALGLVSSDPVGEPERTAIIEALVGVYAGTSSGGAHSAAAYALNRWGQPPLTAGAYPSVVRTNRPPLARNWFVNGQGITMIRIPAGHFTMGDDTGDEDESAHAVALTRDLYLADREVTVAWYQEFVNDVRGDPGYPVIELPSADRDNYQFFNPSADCPMQQVSWYDAIKFCNWLSRKEGLTPCYRFRGTGNDESTWVCDWEATGYRLPTEAEWEYACRARSQTDYSFGNDQSLLPEYFHPHGDARVRTWPAGWKLPNGWGLFGMHGSVWEWCGDLYAEAYYLESPSEDPTGPGLGTERVMRGGLFFSIRNDVRSSNRNAREPTARERYLGFRVAVSASF